MSDDLEYPELYEDFRTRTLPAVRPPRFLENLQKERIKRQLMNQFNQSILEEVTKGLETGGNVNPQNSLTLEEKKRYQRKLDQELGPLVDDLLKNEVLNAALENVVSSLMSNKKTSLSYSIPSRRRKCPLQKANSFIEGKRKRGQDGNWWIVKQTKRGIKKWIPMKK